MQRLRPLAANAAILSRRLDSRGRLSLRDFRMQSGEQPSLCGLLLDRPWGLSLHGPSLRLARLPRTPLLGVDQPGNPYAYPRPRITVRNRSVYSFTVIMGWNWLP